MSGAEKPTPEQSVQDFLQRWSRRKLGMPDADDHAEASPPPAGEADAAPPAEAPQEPAPVFDPKSLPPIESIDATTDIRAFLAPGVPAELTRAALRRAWTSDPAIRDFVGVAENQWDFTNPDAVPGFGSLEFGEDIRGMVARLFGETPAEAPPAREGTTDIAISEGTGQANKELAAPDRPPVTASDPAGVSPPPAEPHCDAENHAAPQNDLAAEERGLGWHRHGGALPK